MMRDASALADALGEAFIKRDSTILQDIYDESITVWHGATGGTMGKTENIGMLSAVFAISSRLEYINIVRHEIAGGIVEQHTLVGNFDDGTPMPDLNACLILKVAGGKITRIEEYFDKDTFTPIWARLAELASA